LPSASGAAALIERFSEVRAQSEALTTPLEIEDYGVQPMDDASPPKWHLAHTSWFFETFLLLPFARGYKPYHPAYEHLFNSYYNGVGQPFPRPRRGHLSRPTVAEVLKYRRHVDEAMLELLGREEQLVLTPEVADRTTLGLHHEQQHQELLLTDLKYNFGHNPLAPVYRAAQIPAVAAGASSAVKQEVREAGFTRYEGGLVQIGAEPDRGFHFDNEAPPHSVYVAPYALSNRVVTCADYLRFMADGGYRTPSLWLSDGWAWVQTHGIEAPLYWSRGADGGWREYRLSGLDDVAGQLPVTHISGYEADAFARWAGCRLPTEAEWEVAARAVPIKGNFADSERFHPSAPGELSGGPVQLYGDVWEWTASAYAPYPGYKAPPGTIGEYNGKFMANQLVLRGGSCATPAGHVRPTYRNFFYPPDRWQFTGIRLAKDSD
jgi:ergothioneine biosynthesis protein EgtB